MSKVINVLITIDTDRVIKDNPSPSKDSGSPISIPHDGYGFMVASGTTVNSGQGSGTLNFNAIEGDVVRVFAVSGSGNFEDGVLLYGMPKFQGDQVMSTFNYAVFHDKSTIVPAGTTAALPAVNGQETFWFFEANVDEPKGTEQYQVQFGLYTRDAVKGDPVLYGYFQWDPTITVGG